jgi:AmmeMemoRadiSam system protein B
MIPAPPPSRPAAAAGRFYPSDPKRLRVLVESLLAEAGSSTEPAPKAIIVPHAGYIYSGPIAASAYARLLPARDSIQRIVLLGPAHFVPLRGVALPSAGNFETPLGSVPVDAEAVRSLRSLEQVRVLDEAHAPEHSLEVQLPFLQVVLKHFSLVPLLAGEASADQIAGVLERVWGGPETRLVISSDLSHYLDSETARLVDRATAEAIESLAPERVGNDQACGRVPIRGLLRAARAHGLRPTTVDLRNSGDTAGPRDQVVGYGAFLFQAPSE